MWVTYSLILNGTGTISGEPQWSVLGQILFLIYVNDLPLSLTSIFADWGKIFADDTTVGASSHSIETLVETLTTDLRNPGVIQITCH